MPKYCNFFVTLECNDTCEFCSMWQNDTFPKPALMEPETKVSVPSENQENGTANLFAGSILQKIKAQGVKYLNITGGEPLLRSDLDQILKQAKQLGFYTILTTNGILYSERARQIVGLVDELYFSLDYPIDQEHDRSRGIECFHQVIQSIHLAKELKEDPIINFTLTRDSVRFLPEMIELATKIGVLVYFNPVYDYYGSQGFEPATIEHIKYYFKRSNVLMDLAMLELVKAKGNGVLFPRCRATETVLTVMPDGKFVKPCYFNQAGVQGRADICSGCMRYPYMLPSFTRGIDKYFFINLFSNWVNNFKRRKKR